jgi:DNA polymerase I
MPPSPEFLTEEEAAALRADGFPPHQDMQLTSETWEQYHAGPFGRGMIITRHHSAVEFYEREAADWDRKAAELPPTRGPRDPSATAIAATCRSHAERHRELAAKHRAWIERLQAGSTCETVDAAPPAVPTPASPPQQMAAPVLVPAMKRARKDPVGRLLSKAVECGVRVRLSGATLEVDGADRLHPDDQALLRTYIEDIRVRLEEPEPEGADLLELLGVEAELVVEAARAREILDNLGDGAIGLDLETCPIAPGNGAARWIKITKDGRRAVHQDHSRDRTGVDPFKACPRLLQLFVPGAGTAYLFDLRKIPIALFQALADHPCYCHSSFDVLVLAAQGVHLRGTLDTLLVARLAYGAERGGLSLAEVVARVLDIELPKGEQTSDWAAERLSERQLVYAAADAVCTYKIAHPLWGSLDAGARRAFRAGNATVRVVVGMRLAGLPFIAATHRATISTWEADYVAARERFAELTGEQIPPAGPQRSAWLEQRIPEDTLRWWPRTDGDQLRCRSADLERLAVVAEIRPLLDVIHWDKRLRAFGHKLLESIGPDGRLHMDLKPAWTKTGRCTCSKHNLQQLPQDVRKAVVTKPRRTMVIADYAQIELRVAAELSGDEAMRQVFRDGQDMHRLNAATFLGIAPEQVSDAQRNSAKGVASFGVLYGSGVAGIVAAAWSRYKLELTEVEVQAYKDWFYTRYPRLRTQQSRLADEAQATGVLRSVIGRPLRAEWEPGGQLKWTQCCNFPVQSSAADVMLLAMARVHAALAGLDARLILQVHDELLIEAAEDCAAEVAALLEREMTAAYLELFPDAPVRGLVDVATRTCWAKPPKEPTP